MALCGQSLLTSNDVLHRQDLLVLHIIGVASANTHLVSQLSKDVQPQGFLNSIFVSRKGVGVRQGHV
jgi:hypothetical protein